MARRALPLAAYAVLRTTDVDEARTSVGAMLAPHRLRPIEVTGFAVHHNAALLGRLSLHYIDYGTAVQVEVDRMNLPLVDIPLAGEIAVESEGRTTKARLGSALVTTREGAQRRHFSAGNPRLMVGFEASLFHERVEVARRVGMRLPRPSSLRIDLSHGKGRSWRRLLETMVADIEYGCGLVTEPTVVGSWEVALADGLIATLTDSRDGTTASTPRENLVRRAARLIDDHCAEPLGTADIAEAGRDQRSRPAIRLQDASRHHADGLPAPRAPAARSGGAHGRVVGECHGRGGAIRDHPSRSPGQRLPICLRRVAPRDVASIRLRLPPAVRRGAGRRSVDGSRVFRIVIRVMASYRAD